MTPTDVPGHDCAREYDERCPAYSCTSHPKRRYDVARAAYHEHIMTCSLCGFQRQCPRGDAFEEHAKDAYEDVTAVARGYLRRQS